MDTFELKQAWEEYYKTIMAAIEKAAKETLLLEISYKDAKENVSNRMIEPYEIKNQGLFAYCLNKNSIRQFKLSQIVNAKVTETKFIPRHPIKIGIVEDKKE